jgi:hypothetical protein
VTDQQPLDLGPIRDRAQRWERKRSRTDRRALLAEVDRLTAELAAEREKTQRVEALAQERCETYVESSGQTCADEPLWHEGDYYGRAPNAPYLANRYCPPCRLRAALDGATNE